MSKKRFYIFTENKIVSEDNAQIELYSLVCAFFLFSGIKEGVVIKLGSEKF